MCSRSMLQHAAAPIFLSSCVCLPCLPAPALFAQETFCLPHVSPVCFYLSCHESVICTNNMQSTVNTKHTTFPSDGIKRNKETTRSTNSAQQCCACCLLHVSSISHRSVGTHMCRLKHAAACRSMPQHAAAQEIFPRDRTCLHRGTRCFCACVGGSVACAWDRVQPESLQSTSRPIVYF